jgi:serine/alanine racemase
VLDADYAEALDGFGGKLHVHVAIDTGCTGWESAARTRTPSVGIFKRKNLIIDGMYTHLCAADSAERRCADYTKAQIEAFFRVVRFLETEGMKRPKLHIQSSYGVVNRPETEVRLCAVGIALYGLLSTRADTENCGLELRPVLSVKARVSAVKNWRRVKVPAMACSSPRGARRGFHTLDRLRRRHTEGPVLRRGCVLLNGERAPVIGRICMDQLTVDVTDIPASKRRYRRDYRKIGGRRDQRLRARGKRGHDCERDPEPTG